MPLKLTIVTSFYPPEKGAAPYRIFNMAKELKARGIDVNVISTLPNYPKGKIFEGYRWRLYKKETMDGIVSRRFWLFASNSNNPFVRIFGMLTYCFMLFFSIPFLLASRPNFIVVQTPPLLPAFVAVIIARIVGIKVILNVSDIWPLTASELGVLKQDSATYKFFSKVEKGMYKRSSAFIGQSQETVDYLKERIPNKPVFLYRNLTKVDSSIWQYAKDKDEKQVFKIVYAGLLGLSQGVCKIAKEIDFKKMNTEFHIYGNGVERDAIEEYIKNNKDCNVFLHETVSKEEIQRILPSFDATIISLKNHIYGALPSKITMAIAAGLPVIFSGAGEGAKLVKENKLGLVSEAGDIESLAQNIEKLSSLSNDQVDTIKNNIFEASQGVFNYEKQLMGLYNFISEQ